METGRGGPAGPAGETPIRRPGSIRRTSSIDTLWPDGAGRPSRLRGVARDMTTPADGSPAEVRALDVIEGTASPLRELVALQSWPPRPRIGDLVGQRAGRQLRAALDAALPEERDAGSPLYLLIDDLAGATLVAVWAWSQWAPDWMDRARRSGVASTAGRGGRMEGVCIGFAPGSSALAPDLGLDISGGVAVPPLARPDDPDGWHPLAPQHEMGMRRARRIDVWREGGLIQVDAAFQDSASLPGGGRAAIHEYGLRATADAQTGRLRSLEAVPRILPYRECPSATANLGRLLGAPLATLRSKVLDELRGTAGCTHLNDMLRALAEVPQLISQLPPSA